MTRRSQGTCPNHRLSPSNPKFPLWPSTFLTTSPTSWAHCLHLLAPSGESGFIWVLCNAQNSVFKCTLILLSECCNWRVWAVCLGEMIRITYFLSISQCSKLLSIKSTGGRTVQLQDRPCFGLWPNRRQLPIRKRQRSLRWRQPKGESGGRPQHRTEQWKCGWVLSACLLYFKMDLKSISQTRECTMKAADFREALCTPIGAWALWTSLVTHWSLKIAQCSQQHRLWSREPGWTLLGLCVFMPCTWTN